MAAGVEAHEAGFSDRHGWWSSLATLPAVEQFAIAQILSLLTA